MMPCSDLLYSSINTFTQTLFKPLNKVTFNNLQIVVNST